MNRRLKLFLILTIIFWAVGFATGICGRCLEPGTWRCGCVAFGAIAPNWITYPAAAAVSYLLAWLLTVRTGSRGGTAA
jgi:hypothetical protein